MLKASIEQQEAAQKLDGLVLFDRGVPDSWPFRVPRSVSTGRSRSELKG
jgi:hypothetical protein